MEESKEDDLMYFESESEDDEPIAKDNINCIHEPDDGKYTICVDCLIITLAQLWILYTNAVLCVLMKRV